MHVYLQLHYIFLWVFQLILSHLLTHLIFLHHNLYKRPQVPFLLDFQENGNDNNDNDNTDVDIQDMGDHYLMMLDLPGMDKNKINLEVTEYSITVSGERKSEVEEQDDTSGFYRMERQFGAFQRTFPIPHGASSDGVSANYENGVLTVTLPKQAEGKDGRSTEKIAIS